MSDQMIVISFGMESTLAIAVAVLLLGRLVKHYVSVLKKFFIPAPVVGGLIFALLALVLYNYKICTFSFDDSLKNLLMVAFFTTIGFAASLRMLVNGGLSVFIFLVISICLIVAQNSVGIGLSYIFGLDPRIGLAAGSISLTGGHGTSGAFGPLLEKSGLVGATSVAIAAATYGLVAGCMIGGPIGRRLVNKFNLKSKDFDHDNQEIVEGKLSFEEKYIDEPLLMHACTYIVVCMGIGLAISRALASIDITMPSYLGPMVVAAIVRNVLDLCNKKLPLHAINMAGSIALQFFLAIALMTMRLWELSALAVPLIVILLVQTFVMAIFAYFITFRFLGCDYDAAVIATGHCGFGLGATPNAIANMTTFTSANGHSPKAFFVVPLVGALFIDFVNTIVLTTFIGFMS